MKSNGIEYRILKDAAGKNFKVEIKQQGFMGFEEWRDLKALGYSEPFVPHNPVLKMKTRYFDSCKEAKEAAIEYFNESKIKSGWTECKC